MPRLKAFQDEMPIPEVVRPLPGVPTAHHLSISAHAENLKLHVDLPPTEVWKYRLNQGNVVHQGSGSTYLGPTIEVRRAEHVIVAWHNAINAITTLPFEVIKANADKAHPVPQNEPGQVSAIPEAVDKVRNQMHGLHAALVTHLHGGRTQADSDGWADNTILSGQVAHYSYPNDQAATLLWYHDHCMHVTRLNVFAGLAGAWIIRDDEEHSLQLPHGDHEIPLIIQDRNLDTDAAGNFTGALLHKTEVNNAQGPAEFFGPYTLVNGKIWPKLTIEPRLYRFRVLNGSNARTYRLMLLDGDGNIAQRAVWQIGCDQGLMQNKTAIPDDGLVLMPAERADLLVDFASFAGKHLYLWNTADAPFGDEPANKPDARHVKAELLSLVADPTASADTVDPNNATNRRLFPQVMRFDVRAKTTGPSGVVPADPLWKTSRPALVFDDKTPIRFMGLVEAPPADPTQPDATTMLVFWEFVPTSEQPAPPGAEVVTVKYWHPGKGAFDTQKLWKAAEQFYDQLNWRVHLDATELWYVINLSADSHPIHVHLVDMTVNQRYAFVWDGQGAFDPSKDKLTKIDATDSIPIEPNVLGPKDTVRVNPGEMVGIAMTFSPFPGRYMYHCHILEHEDHDMMRPFVVVPKWIPHHDH